MFRYEYSLIKNLLTHWEIRKENQKTTENILALYQSWWVLKDDYVTSEKLFNLMTGDWGKKPIRLIDEKTS